MLKFPRTVVSTRIGWLVALAWPLALAGQDQVAPKLEKRYGYAYEPILFSQKTPEEALKSLVKAIDGRRIDYLLAQLADPKFVDERVKEYSAFQKGTDQAKTIYAFERLIRETTLHFQEDPVLMKELRQYLKDADWDVKEDVASGTLKTPSPRKVFFRKVEERWFLENRQK
jgi:hypothetical protein